MLFWFLLSPEFWLVSLFTIVAGAAGVSLFVVERREARHEVLRMAGALGLPTVRTR